MRIDAMIVNKDLPDWANGHVAYIEGKYLMLLKSKPRKVYPMWWNKIGRFIGWRWLAYRCVKDSSSKSTGDSK